MHLEKTNSIQIQNQQLQDKIKNEKFVSATINLAVPSSIQFPHSHNEPLVLLYYINPDTPVLG